MSAPEIYSMFIIFALSFTGTTVGADRLSIFQDFNVFTEGLKKHSVITLLLGSLELSFWWEQRNPNTAHQSESLDPSHHHCTWVVVSGFSCVFFSVS